jgi:sulfur-oxidizing protein SoxA
MPGMTTDAQAAPTGAGRKLAKRENAVPPVLRKLIALVFCAGLGLVLPARAQDDPTEKEIERYRQMLKDDPWSNPGNLWVDRGEMLWQRAHGPKNASLERCDLGLGAGMVDGAYAQLPRFFADADRVMDVEARLVWCMDKLQGLDPHETARRAYSNRDRTSELEALVSFVASRSNGLKFALRLDHPKEREAYAVGEALFYRRQGPMDFGCVTCHADDGKRIRLQQLPFFGDAKSAQEVVATWPAYRVSQETVRTMQHRMYDCYWQMRLPELDHGSDVSIALITYLTKRGEGGAINVPSLKR